MNKRPRIKIPLTALDYILEIVAVLSIVGIIILTVIYWINAPEIVPAHYNLAGEVTRYGSKMESIAVFIILAFTNIFTYALITILNKSPHIFNFPVNVTEENAFFLYKTTTRMVRWLKLLCCLLITYIVWGIVKADLTEQKFGLDIIFLLLTASTIVYPIFMIVRIIKYDKKQKKCNNDKRYN